MSDIRNRILIVDDDAQIAAGLDALLSDDWDVRTASTGREAVVAFAEFSPDVVLLDVQLPDTTGIDLLHQFKAYSETTAVIMMSGGGTLERVVESMRLGAETFLQKPFDADVLIATLEQVPRMIATRRSSWHCAAAKRVRSRGCPASRRRSTISTRSFLRSRARRHRCSWKGSRGAGKGVMARLIHNRSPRSAKPFVDLNCAGLSKELLESELFGHERGAFTNATTTKPGPLRDRREKERCSSTRSAEMEPTVQARLLKAIEDKRFRRVGGAAGHSRRLPAARRDESRSAGGSGGGAVPRRSLLPPQRRAPSHAAAARADRGRARSWSKRCSPLAKEIGRPVPKVSARAMKKWQRYAWPGNVRELRNVLERALLTLRGDEIRNEDLVLDSATASLPSTRGGLPSDEWEIQPLDDVIASYVKASVDAAGGNVRKAARQLKISPSTLYARLK